MFPRHTTANENDVGAWARVLFSEKITYALRITHYVFSEEDAK